MALTAHLFNGLQHSVNTTFICTGKPKHSRDLLYCGGLKPNPASEVCPIYISQILYSWSPSVRLTSTLTSMTCHQHLVSMEEKQSLLASRALPYPAMMLPLLLQELITGKFWSSGFELRILGGKIMPYPSQPSACPILIPWVVKAMIFPNFPPWVNILPFQVSRGIASLLLLNIFLESNSTYIHLEGGEGWESSSILKAILVCSKTNRCFYTLSL